MKIIGEKLSNQELLSIKGGEATCFCQGHPGSEFTLPSGDPGVILAMAQAWCYANYGTYDEQCSGLDIVWE
ncbi:hypothetical protein [uncultured Roseivirga sp.]|uniref:hypothetical protein n=1 Tax=uncultured Roseivirga sp. TaxID=543088 RepID=UPI0030D97FF3|tara:strand:- start:3436 stop:3648 length:213 start_codon:yes stop_codon:yes gene_type:complete